MNTRRAVGPVEAVQSRIGSREASELRDPRLGMVVRALVLNPNEAYAFALAVHRSEIDPDVYGLFDLMCSSVEFLPE